MLLKRDKSGSWDGYVSIIDYVLQYHTRLLSDRTFSKSSKTVFRTTFRKVPGHVACAPSTTDPHELIQTFGSVRYNPENVASYLDNESIPRGTIHNTVGKTVLKGEQIWIERSNYED